MNSLISYNHSQIQILGLGTEVDPEESWTTCLLFVACYQQ